VFLKWIIAYVLSIFLSLIAQSFYGKFFDGYGKYHLPCSKYLVLSIRVQFSRSVQYSRLQNRLRPLSPKKKIVSTDHLIHFWRWRVAPLSPVYSKVPRQPPLI
jgi:hypothetical protein